VALMDKTAKPEEIIRMTNYAVGLVFLEDETPYIPGTDIDRDLAPYGDIIDPEPYLSILSNVITVSAGLDMERIPSGDTMSDKRPDRIPVRAVVIHGDCMMPYLGDQDVALVALPERVQDGDLVTALIDFHMPTCKRIRIVEDKSWLEPLNGEGEVQEDRYTVTGVVVGRFQFEGRFRKRASEPG
jgi:phage repressor protein C with HTH and peptisase S24 domain